MSFMALAAHAATRYVAGTTCNAPSNIGIPPGNAGSPVNQPLNISHGFCSSSKGYFPKSGFLCRKIYLLRPRVPS
jgi:hypothetical protein